MEEGFPEIPEWYSGLTPTRGRVYDSTITMTEDLKGISTGGRYRVFISHGRPDRWIAVRIRKDLHDAGIETFLDLTDISIGDNFRAVVLKELRGCDEVLVLLTPSSLKSAWVFAEIGAAAMTEKLVVAIFYGVTMEELHERGIVSLIGDVALIELNDDDLNAYIVAVRSRAGARNNA